MLTQRQLRGRDVPARRLDQGEVRDEAEARGLAVARKPDSHDICFIADGDTGGFLRARLGIAPRGRSSTRDGALLGTHDGAYAFTVGQRKGLRLGHRPRRTAGRAMCWTSRR